MDGEKRFVRLPVDSVSLCAEHLGIQTSQEVASVLVEDVSFRIRQLTDTARQFMHHAKRRRLMVDDFDKALKWSSVEPLYGHNSIEPVGFQSIHERGLYSLSNEHEVGLNDVALSPPLDTQTLPDPPTVKASWLAVEGVSLGKEGEEATVEGLPVLELKRTTNESHHRYLSLILEAVTGEGEDLRRVALLEVQTNASVANILPRIVQYIRETLSCWTHFSPAQLLRLLKLILALLRNTNLFLNPYAPSLFPPLHSMILSPSYLHCRDGFDHWNLRHLAAISLAELVRRCGSPLEDFPTELHGSFDQLLSQSETSLPVLYGAVLTLCYIGGKSIAEVMFPRLDAVASRVHYLLNSSDLTERESALRVYETLLLSGELLLTSSNGLPPPPVSQEQLAALSHPSPPPGQAAGITDSSIFANSSFGAGMDVVGGDMADSEEPSRDVPTLYGYLVDIFGESLVQRLSSHADFKSPCQDSAKRAPKQEQSDEPSSIHSKPSFPPPREDPIMRFLQREGFRPIKILLPRAPPHPPHPHHVHYFQQRVGRPPWTFPLPRPLLPVRGNMLDVPPRTGRPGSEWRRRRESNPSAGARGNLAKSKGRRSLMSDVSSSWL